MRISFEVFPPKITDGIEKIYACLDGLASLKPDFISVTYSAGNAQKGLTAEVCGCIQKDFGVKAVSHITCAGATKEKLLHELQRLKEQGTDTLLALRGDLVAGKKIISYPHATDLIEEIERFGGFTVCAACYPDGHPESGSIYDDVTTLNVFEPVVFGQRGFFADARSGGAERDRRRVRGGDHARYERTVFDPHGEPERRENFRSRERNDRKVRRG